MEVYKLKKPYTSVIFPAVGIFVLVCFYPQIKLHYWISIIPILLIAIGSFVVYKRITYRVTISDSTIAIANKSIQWDSVKRVISYQQMVESGSGIRKVNKLAIVYAIENNRRKTICITPKDMDKPVAIINSIKKRFEITGI